MLDEQNAGHLNDELLEAFVLGQMPAELAGAPRRHLENCSQCTDKLNEKRQEINRLTALLGLAPDAPVEDCLDDLPLARFLDGSSPEDERSSVVAHLARCPECRRRAAGLYRTVQQAKSGTLDFETEPVVPQMAPFVPAPFPASRTRKRQQLGERHTEPGHKKTISDG
ncbi:MAG: zf-HC2 domain-containing protein [Candidatus Hydrogenedentes bacterium]|nr:zf-HC2 domain-containing protein [Candidatus Hydrogenedentota bacterium]MBI3119596.1 zf-HC2 domain-containing protein [Candidatus Hydrogenedentota bacterium]